MRLGRESAACTYPSRGFDSLVSVLNAYMECGCLEVGWCVFIWIGRRRNVVSWNSLISGYGMHDFGLSWACSHAGLVEEGNKIFESMGEYNVTPRAEHYISHGDLLGHAGHLDEAVQLIQSMRIEPTPEVWVSLLGVHGHVEYAEMVEELKGEFVTQMKSEGYVPYIGFVLYDIEKEMERILLGHSEKLAHILRYYVIIVRIILAAWNEEKVIKERSSAIGSKQLFDCGGSFCL
ncbi:hypothetical protein HU200_026114 [Digitaria exilis]|uniref:Pentatricopeptide repeat-containing protein n=1 Tax=Digitaria exilis TaxID=1010633 RepID=A0A835EXH8_9POAL|nr:hypothetical protein HU200_026114 [Digitaria exilis]